MTTELLQERPSAEIEAVLAALRGRIRRYVFAEGLALLLAAAVCLAWTSIAIDWLFEPERAFRITALVAAAVLLGCLLYRWIIGRLAASIRQSSLALLLERRFPQLADQLITAVEPAGL